MRLPGRSLAGLRLVLVCALGAVAIGGCGSSTTSPTPTLGPGGSPTVPASAGASTPGNPSTGPEQYTCDEPYASPSQVAQGNAHLIDVRVVSVPGHDELRFTYDGSGLPGLQMEQVSPPFTQDPSGLPMQVLGGAYLRLRFSPSSMFDDQGNPTFPGQVDLNPNAPSLKQLRLQGDTGGVTSWIAGFGGPLCYQVWFEGDTMVVWLQHPS